MRPNPIWWHEHFVLIGNTTQFSGLPFTEKRCSETRTELSAELKILPQWSVCHSCVAARKAPKTKAYRRFRGYPRLSPRHQLFSELDSDFVGFHQEKYRQGGLSFLTLPILHQAIRFLSSHSCSSQTWIDLFVKQLGPPSSYCFQSFEASQPLLFRQLADLIFKRFQSNSSANTLANQPYRRRLQIDNQREHTIDQAISKIERETKNICKRYAQCKIMLQNAEKRDAAYQLKAKQIFRALGPKMPKGQVPTKFYTSAGKLIDKSLQYDIRLFDLNSLQGYDYRDAPWNLYKDQIKQQSQKCYRTVKKEPDSPQRKQQTKD